MTGSQKRIPFFLMTSGLFWVKYLRFKRVKHAESITSRKVENLPKNLDIRLGGNYIFQTAGKVALLAVQSEVIFWINT